MTLYRNLRYYSVMNYAKASNAVKTNIFFALESTYISHVDENYSNPVLGDLTIYTLFEKNLVQMIHSISGNAIIKTKSKTLHIGANELVFSKHGDCPTIITENSKWDFYTVWFFYENLEIPFSQIINMNPLPNEKETLETIISLLNTREFNSVGKANGLAQALICDILGKLPTRPLGQYVNGISDAVDYINTNVNAKLTVPELAGRLHLCEKHFRTLFEKQIGMNPKQYIMKAKLEKSIFLLTHTDMPISDIAYSLSFASPTHYINAFKKYYKTTPLNYKKHNGKQILASPPRERKH